MVVVVVVDVDVDVVLDFDLDRVLDLDRRMLGGEDQVMDHDQVEVEVEV